jgi:uncharacterized protein (TIGR02271 family)
MTLHADQLVGASVTDSDGLGVGKVEQVFRNDADGTPSWARIRSAKGLHFVPLTGCTMMSGGRLSVPFDSRKIMSEPSVKVDRHMSLEQEERLRAYYGIKVPAQPTRPTRKETIPPGRIPASRPRPDQAQVTGLTEAEAGQATTEWLTRSEERIVVDLETHVSGRVKLRKFVDTEPVSQTVHVFHEEYDVERIPIDDDQVVGELAASEDELFLHETRANVSKKTIQVERVRLTVRKVEEDKTITGEVRKERFEVDDSSSKPESAADRLSRSPDR